MVLAVFVPPGSLPEECPKRRAESSRRTAERSARRDARRAPGEPQKGFQETQNEPPEAPGAKNISKIVVLTPPPKCPPGNPQNLAGSPRGPRVATRTLQPQGPRAVNSIYNSIY